MAGHLDLKNSSPFFLYNSMTQKKELFAPLNPPKVDMYCCGPTVYDLLHIGNFRGAVFFNLLSQWLRHKGYTVRYAYNWTDVDDKILNKARQKNKTMKDIADQYIAEFKKDFKALKLKPHNFNPQATHFIPDMIKVTQQLIKNKKAYVVKGNVFFAVKSFKDYGKLSGRKLEELISGARVAVDESKHYGGDFALWKACSKEEPGWDSPWGWGRPGWHIECTSMIFSLFGPQIDIHGGGRDLIFPHHENELAQAEGSLVEGSLDGLSASIKKPFVKYWVHNNMFTSGGEKMAKSTGNVSVMRDFLKEYNGEIFKYLVLSSHYRSAIEVSPKKIEFCVKALIRIYTFLNTSKNLIASFNKDLDSKAPPSPSPEEQEIIASLNDDLNTPVMLAVLFKMIRQFNELASSLKQKQEQVFMALKVRSLILKYGELMSLFQEEPSIFLEQIKDIFLKQKNIDKAEVIALIEQRAKARGQKNFDLADQIRQQLLNLNIEVQDNRDGKTTWTITTHNV